MNDLMLFFDWLLGRSHIGWLKTVILSALLGLLITGILFGESEIDARGDNRYFFIALGFPLLYLIRSIYWKMRLENLEEKKRQNIKLSKKHINSIEKYHL